MTSSLDAAMQPLAAPRLPEPAPPFRLPIVAIIAPMLAAVIMWLVTSSPFVLVFAALGPVTAVASLVDSRIGSRRALKRDLTRFRADCDGIRSTIAERHAIEVAGRAEVHPLASDLLARRGADPGRWSVERGAPVFVAVGTGSVRSALTLERPVGSGSGWDLTAQLDELGSLAEQLHDAPVAIDARLGIGVCGPPRLVQSHARALALQLAWALPPDRYSRAGRISWLDALPHAAGAEVARPGTVVKFESAEGELLIAAATTEAELPGSCRVVLRVGESGATIIRHPDREQRREYRPVLVSQEEAHDWACRARESAVREGLVHSGSALPEEVPLTPLLREPSPDDRSLACEVGMDGAGPVTLDLVEHGPHAIIGGTTGSGKSELLVAWVLAMAATHPPERVTFLLVDFKGGSAFGALTALPHTVGIITDLDATEAARALASLRAELRYRERALAEQGVRDIEQATGLPRLVIVVDEFAAMLAEHPDLHTLFTDLAARGRSLGVHLVLCTQRPAGVVRDAVLANADLRISLRVNNRADSAAVVGTDAAAALPAEARGRGILSLAGAEPRAIQVALADDRAPGLVAARWADSAAPRRPWCEPLPRMVRPSELAKGAGVAFGLLDLPEEQRRDTARWDGQGNLLVLGAQGSGKSTLLDRLATAPSPRWIPEAADAAWDTVAELSQMLERGEGGGIVLVDNLDSLLARFSSEHRVVFVERLTALLRDGPGRGIRLVASAQRLSGELHSLATLFPARLLLGQSSREEFVLAGGEGAQFVPGLPPGGGLWRGHRVQVAMPEHGGERDYAPASVAELGAGSLAIVSSRAVTLATRLREGGVAVRELANGAGELEVSSGPRRTVIVGDVEEWQSRWGALATLRPAAQILFDGCSIADYRATSRSRQLPPPLPSSPPEGALGWCWRLEGDGSASRVRLAL